MARRAIVGSSSLCIYPCFQCSKKLNVGPRIPTYEGPVPSLPILMLQGDVAQVQSIYEEFPRMDDSECLFGLFNQL